MLFWWLLLVQHVGMASRDAASFGIHKNYVLLRINSPLHIVTILNRSDELSFQRTTSLHWPQRSLKLWSNISIYFLMAAEINPFLLSALQRQSRLISSWHIQKTTVHFWRRIWFDFLVLKLPPDLDIDFLNQFFSPAYFTKIQHALIKIILEVDVEHGDNFIRAAQEQTRHFHSLALIIMGFLLHSNLTFQKQVMDSSAMHLWLANLKHHKGFGVWSTGDTCAGWEPGLVQLCRTQGAQTVAHAVSMCKRLMTSALCSKAVLSTKRLNLLQWQLKCNWSGWCKDYLTLFLLLICSSHTSAYSKVLKGRCLNAILGLSRLSGIFSDKNLETIMGFHMV